MGKKKRAQVFVLKPWCWYCEREFEDDKVLLQHQKSKHFKFSKYTNVIRSREYRYISLIAHHDRLTNTLPGRDGYDIEIFGMEGVPTNALAEWKARKEAEAGTAALASAASARRPRQSYNVIPEADLQGALAQHKLLMAARNNPAPAMPFPPFNGAPPFPPGPPPGFRPPFPPAGVPPFSPVVNSPVPIGSPVPGVAVNPPPIHMQPVGSASPAKPVEVQPPKDGLMWPDVSASPTEGEDGSGVGKKRKAAADFL
ncbi:hypothetical protein IAR55_005002 [Kwoniella newhampshirensis]|uniref:C2H2-type domain-containing protein n=1 Tax=Kwoniella newhampshirensis TaxID=1651941 RepID=A0AAW0YX10_9TREE